MKLAKHDNVLETNAETVSQEFEIGDASVIIGMLRNNVYKHKLGTPIQEYMSNGRDAQREAKSNMPCVVTLPTSLNPTFKVRDFGPGITPDRIDKVLRKYGNSTKRGTNGQTGGFGVGAKSAWAYTDSFTVVSISGGKKRTYVCHTGRDNKGEIDLISEIDTTEPTGTEIQIAIKHSDISACKAAVFRTCYFWKREEYPEIKNLHEIDKQYTNFKYVAGFNLGNKDATLELVTSEIPSFLRLETNRYSDTACSIIIDGIPYSVDDTLVEHVPSLKAILDRVTHECHPMLHIGNGVVEVALSREEISHSDFTKTNLEQLAGKLEKTLASHISKEFKNAATNAAWINVYNKYSKFMLVDAYSKRGGYEIVDKSIGSKQFDNFQLLEVGPNTGRRSRGGWTRGPETTIDLTCLDHVFYLDDKDEAIVTQNRRVAEYLQKNPSCRKVVILIAKEKTELTVTPVPAGAPFGTQPISTTTVKVKYADSLKAVNVVSKDLNARALSTLSYTMPVRIPKAKRDRTAEDFTMHVHRWLRKSPTTTTLAKIKASDEMYLYIEFSEYESMKHEFEAMREFCDSEGWQLCAMTKDAIKHVKNEHEFLSYREWLKSYKPDAKLIATLCGDKAENKEAIKLLSYADEKIKDKTIVAMIEAYRPILKADQVKVPKLIESMVSKEVKEFKDADAELTKLLKTSYPLVNVVRDLDLNRKAATANELVYYINSKV